MWRSSKIPTWSSSLRSERSIVSILETAHRLVIVARHFWPMTDESSHRLLQWIDGLRQCSIDVHVVTARWHPSWPERSVLRGAQVTRLLPPPRSNWNEGQFQKHVLTWLAQHADACDAIYVDRADGLASAIAAKASKWGKPVVARFAVGEDSHGIARGQWLAPAAAADACRRCDRIVVPSAAAHRILISEGIDPKRIERIADWVATRAPRTMEARAAAGAALFQVSSDFVIPGRTELIVHYGPTQTKDLLALAHSICDVLDLGFSVRCWILGSGDSHPEVCDAIKDRGWHREILLFDGFDDLEEIASVADLAIVSNPANAFQFSALMFLNADIPMIIAEGPETKGWIAEGQPIHAYASSRELVSQLQNWKWHRVQWDAQAAAWRAHALGTRHSSIKAMGQWETMLRTLSIGTTR